MKKTLPMLKVGLIGNMDMLYAEKETTILQALIARKGMQHIVDTAARILGNPLFVCDLGYKILCCSQNGPAEDPFWKSLLEHDYSMPEPIFQIMRSGDFAKVYALDDPQIGQYAFAQYPFLAARIRDGSHVMGHICVYASEVPFREEDQKLLVLICKVVAYEMLYRGLSVSNEIPYYTLLIDLLEGRLKDRDELCLRQQCLGLRLPDQMVILAVVFRNPMMQATVFYIREYLLRQLENSLGIVYEGRILLIVPESVLTCHLLEDILVGYETNVDYRVGISDPAANLGNLDVYYRQAVDAVRISDRLKLEERLCFYQELKIYQILLCAGKELNLKFLCSPIVLRMLNYDKQYNTEYLKDLEIYLNCGKNMNKAAARACVHKNSMYYRIAKMTELFGLSLEDEDACFLLRLSLKILRLLET